MSSELVALLYLVSGVLFILALRQHSVPDPAQNKDKQHDYEDKAGHSQTIQQPRRLLGDWSRRLADQPSGYKMITLWGRGSSANVQKVMWALAELNLQFRHVIVGGPYGGTTSEEFKSEKYI